MTSRIGKTRPLLPSFIKKKFAQRQASLLALVKPWLSLAFQAHRGGHGPSKRACLISKQGFTFIELMVTLAVLSFGIVMVYKAFFASLDQINYLNHRLYATIFLDNQLTEMQRAYKSSKTVPMNFASTESVEIGYKTIDFKPTKVMTPVEDIPFLFQVDLSVSWTEKGDRTITLSRSAYIGEPGFVSNQNEK